MTARQLIVLLIAVLICTVGMTAGYLNKQATETHKEIIQLKLQNDSLQVIVYNIKYLTSTDSQMLRNYQEAFAQYRLLDSAGAKHFGDILEGIDIGR